MSHELSNTIKVAFPANLLMGKHILIDGLHVLLEKRQPSRIAIIVDEQIPTLHSESWKTLLDFLGANLVKTLEATEHNKSIETLMELAHWLLIHHVGRSDLVLAVGGGMISDVVGMASAICKRGIPWVIVPTTVLSMVDASIGGKVGVNTEYGKNSLGAFHLPYLVVSDTQFLSTLPKREFLSGTTECLKSLLLCDGEYYHELVDIFLEYDVQELFRHKYNDQNLTWDDFMTRITPYLFYAQQQKWEVVEQDPQEKKGIRQVLNYGHTLGHALELYSQFTITHGEAVAIGIQFANFVAMKLGILSRAQFDQIFNTFRQLHLFPSFHESPTAETLFRLMLHDKKNNADGIHFVFIRKPGQIEAHDGLYTTPLQSNELLPLLKEYLQSYLEPQN
jgi:3-dehydroquinate synthase